MLAPQRHLLMESLSSSPSLSSEVPHASTLSKLTIRVCKFFSSLDDIRQKGYLINQIRETKLPVDNDITGLKCAGRRDKMVKKTELSKKSQPSTLRNLEILHSTLNEDWM